MDQAYLQQRLTTAFVAELEEHVGALNRDALALEAQPSGAERDELLRRLFRTAHTVKSAARAVGAPPVEAAAHRLEDLLAAARDGAVAVDDVLFTVLFEAADAFEECRGRLRDGQALDGSSVTALLARVDALAKGEPVRAPARSARAPRPAPAPAPAAPRPAPTGRFCRTCGGELADGAPCAACAPTLEPPPHGGGLLRLAPAKLDVLLERASELLTAVRALDQPERELDDARERLRTWGREALELERDLLAAPATATASLRARLRQASSRWRDAESDLERLTTRVGLHRHELERLIEPLLDDVRRARMLPFSEACQGFDRLVRDLAHQAGKEVVLRVEGGGVELDRVVLEQLKDPLRHLVRNAIDHGLENEAERRAVGKPAAGTVTVGASVQGPQVTIVVRDDGRGVDRASVASEAARRGLPPPADDAELAAMLFRPGFSTARVVTDVSGRGVGLDVVRERVEAMQGSVTLDSEAGRGAAFTLSVPLSLSGTRALLVRVGRATFALPCAAVAGLFSLTRSDIVRVDGRDVAPWQGRHLPLVHLGTFLGVPADPIGAALSSPVVVIAGGDRAAACVVDELLAEQEIMVRALGARLRHLPALAGATLLPDGRVALILGATALLRAGIDAPRGATLATTAATRAPARAHILLVEDSLTTRSLEKMILEAAGFFVTPAVDGRDALDRLDALEVDLVVSDVQMPRVDGIELTRALRGSARFAALPIVLVTGMSSDVDRQRGLEAGANAYLVKSAFDQAELLATLEQLLGRRPA